MSIDGFKKSHEFFRGPGTFDKSLKFVEMCQKMGYAIEINSILSNNLIKQLSMWGEFLLEKKVKNLLLLPLDNNPHYAESLESDFVTIKNEFGKLDKVFGLPQNSVRIDLSPPDRSFLLLKPNCSLYINHSSTLSEIPVDRDVMRQEIDLRKHNDYFIRIRNLPLMIQTEFYYERGKCENS